MIKRFKSKALVLTVLLATGASLAQTNTTPSDQPAQTTEQSQVVANSVKLELFSDQPSDSSQPLTTLEVSASGGNLGAIEVPDEANKGRYLRISVTSAAGVQTYLYRVIAAPSTGRVFIITPDKRAIALNKFLISSGLNVSKDKAVKLGAQTSFSTDETTQADTAASTTETTPAASTAPADTSTTSATPSDSSTATPPTDTSATAPADTSTTSTTPSDSSTTNATTPADSNTTTAPGDASSTTPASATAPADTSTTAPADSSTAAPANSSTTTATPSDPSSAAGAEATALTEPVNTTLGNVQLSVVATGASAPQSSASNFILVPVTDATNAKSSLAGNVVTLSYASASSIEDVSKFYDEQLKAQGFVRDDANAANQSSADQVVSVYQRGNASVTITVRAEGGTYTVMVDLGNLAQATGN